MTGKIYLNFDLEEFDIPCEYGQPIKEEEQIEVTSEGLKRLLELLQKKGLKATFFTTASFALNKTALAKNLLELGHEIASHGLDHKPKAKEEDLFLSKKILEEISSVPVLGYRSPRFRPVDPQALLSHGYAYNSSINPTWLPGRYNYLHYPRKIFSHQGLVQVPISTTPIVRLPLCWLSFKNLPPSLFNLFSWITLKEKGYLNIFFHPWEFAPIQNYAMPKAAKSLDGKALLKRLEEYINWLMSLEVAFAKLGEVVGPVGNSPTLK
ncbi:polysaccharide deacetylase family protein [Candidatus Methylacidiphilum infernorum]|uniref:Predicted xylanase/chitin deacetylase n=1 Tax=Methylacidiphilum infernorum (isolate V4) TaxID=481448 RepID=B3E093_METI4|nr:polysaccharide deacetylase family protein [Candidatus Methylacidiphilum infernorum]ACD84322.1 Predicted xylanase/chitin deacetylase [Methylacidiphilum infernorum V4]